MSKRLVGADGKLQVGTFGTEIVAAATLDAGTWYKVIAIDGTASIFPTGAVPGYLYKADGTETLATNDIAAPWEGTDLCDVSGWSMDWSKDEIETTTMCDAEKTYRAGKGDIAGNVDGIFTTEITDTTGGLMNQFVTIVKQDMSLSDPADYVVSLAQGAEVLGFLYADETTVAEEWEAFYLVPMSLTGFSSSAGGEDAQTFASPFRVAASETGVVFYEYKNPAA